MGTNLVFRDIGALAAARRLGTTLDSEKLQAAAPDDKKDLEVVKPVEAETSAISKPLEALRAVVPATIAAMYSALVIPLQTLSIAAGAGAKADHETALAKQFATDPAGLKKALETLPVETAAYFELRLGVAIVVAIFVFIFAFRKAQTVKNRVVLLEPAIATAAFVAWALASPGTFLAAKLTASELAIWSLAIAGVAAIGLVAFSSTTLSKKAGTKK
jgi:hypothetical protein